jgi:large subunit ribosomal protein L21
MKYAVLESGGKQYIARPGEMIEVDLMPLDVGQPVKFKNVLLAVDGSSVRIGQPLLKGAVVEGKVVDQIKARKILVFKYKPRIRYRRKQGHRQRYTQVSIEKITLPKPASEKTEVAPAVAAKASGAAPKAAAAAPKKTASPAKKTTAKPAAPKKTPVKASQKKPTTKAAKPTAKEAAPKTAPKKKPDTKATKPAAKGTGSKPASKKSTSSKQTGTANKTSPRTKKEDKK